MSRTGRADAQAGRRGGTLLRHRDFRLFWFSETITTLGGAVSATAIPLVAVVTLHASAFQVGLLAAMGQLPYLVLGLPAGAWVDRLRRRPVMVTTDLARAGVLLLVPASVLFGILHLWTLYAVALVSAGLRTFFEPRLARVPARPRQQRPADRRQR